MCKLRYKFHAVCLFMLLSTAYGTPQPAADTSLIISEIMFSPDGLENEFIEIFNTGPADINLSGYKIKYYTSSPDNIVSAGQGTVLRSGAYAVIFEGDYDFQEGIYKSLVPSESLILKIDNNSFGTSGMANTTGRPVCLTGPQGDTCDIVIYTADNAAGISDEKLKLTRDNSAANWKNSLNKNGTPGGRNSVSPEKPLIPRQYNDVVINEIMFAPKGDEPEWAELYNRSGDTVNLRMWTFSDVLTKPVSAVITQKDLLLPPGQYFIAARDSAVIYYHRAIPSRLAYVKLPVLNNDRDGVVIKDSYGNTIDSVFYDASGSGISGESLERKYITSPSGNSDNWDFSKDIELGTPGRMNSVSPRQYDLCLSSFWTSPRFPVSGDDISLGCTVINQGMSPADNFSVLFYYKKDSSSVRIPLYTAECPALAPEELFSAECPVKLKNLRTKISAGASVLFASDEDTLNNRFETGIQPGAARNSVVINEIMYDPVIGKSEWVELFNAGTDAVSLNGWALSDIIPSQAKAKISGINLLLRPGEYLMVARDSTAALQYGTDPLRTAYAAFGLLGNIEDGLMLYDFRGGIIDSTRYSSKTGGGKGISIERMDSGRSSCDSTNWGACLADIGSTPASVNSLSGLPSVQAQSIVINEIMYDPASGDTEFIELYNNTPGSFNLPGWSVADGRSAAHRIPVYYSAANSGAGQRSGSKIRRIEPYNYFLIAGDSSVFSTYNLYNDSSRVWILSSGNLDLSNEGDIIILKDPKYFTVDSVYYSPKWNNPSVSITKGLSLERITPGGLSDYPANWSTCLSQAGATPLKRNSVAVDRAISASKINVSPNPFSPDNDGFEDFTVISYELPQNISLVRIKIFDSKGRLVRTVTDSRFSSQKGEVIFDGRDNDGRALRMGIYIIFLEALSQGSTVAETMKTVVVVARKL